MPTSRVEAFSDGVFAIIVTLLVLDLRVPHTAGSPVRALVEQWASYVGYTLSFLIVGVIWVNHHAMFVRIRTVDRTLVFANLLLLLCVAAIPFPTALTAEYLRAGHDAEIGAVIYGAMMTGMGTFFSVTWLWADRRGLLEPDVSPAQARSMGRRSLTGTAVYAAATVLAAVAALPALAVCALVTLFFVLDPVAGSSTGDPALPSAPACDRDLA